MPTKMSRESAGALLEKYGLRENDPLKLRAIRQKRHQRERDGQAIMDKASKAGRAMTGTEEREFDRLMDERDELNELDDYCEAQRERIIDDLEREEGGNPAGRDNGPGIRFTTADGRSVRGIVHGESFARLAGGRTGWRTERDIDTEELSLGRALVGMISGDRDVMEREMRANVVSLDPQGGFFVQPELAGLFIDLARSQSILSQAGAITIPLNTGETRILRVSQDPQAAWKAELHALNETDVRFESVQLYPKPLGCVVDISEELVQDGANAAAQIENVLVAAIADQLDRSLFVGITDEFPGRTFHGIIDDPDVNTVDMGSSAPAAATAFDEIIDAIQLVEEANGMPDVHILSPRTWGQYGKLKDTQNQPIQMPAAVAALRHLRTTQVPTDLGAGSDESVSVVGNFRSGFVILGIRNAFKVEVSREAGNAFENLGRKVRVWGRADMAIGRPSHLSLIENIGAPA
jgi:HK97 family phage major capsid protein